MGKRLPIWGKEGMTTKTYIMLLVGQRSLFPHLDCFSHLFLKNLWRSSLSSTQPDASVGIQPKLAQPMAVTQALGGCCAGLEPHGEAVSWPEHTGRACNPGWLELEKDHSVARLCLGSCHFLSKLEYTSLLCGCVSGGSQYKGLIQLKRIGVIEM